MIEDLLVAIGVEDVRSGTDEVGGRCPRHEARTGQREHKPDNWSVNRMTGMHHCFSCGYKGSLVRLVVDVAGIGLWEAHQLLHRYDVVLEEPLEAAVWTPPTLEEDLRRKLTDFGSPPKRAMVRRRLTERSIKRFRVQWDYEESAWVLPICGPAGDVWGWQIKTVEYVRNRPPGIRKSRTLFGIDIPRRDTSVVLVESPLDAVYLDGLGYPAMASFGAAVSDMQMRLVLERFDELTLALDNDKAGRSETERLLAEHWHHRLPIHVFNYRSITAKDPGECKPNQVHAAMSDATLAAFW